MKQQEEKQFYGAWLGYLLEVGFNVGFLQALRYLPHIKTYCQDDYYGDLERLYPPRIVDALIKKAGALSSYDRHIVQQWAEFLWMRGYIGGYTLCHEFFSSIGASVALQTQVVYLQCDFFGKNSLGTQVKNDYELAKNRLQQFKQAGFSYSFNMDDYETYSDTGAFLHADTLLLVKQGNAGEEKWRVLCIDHSLFSVREFEDTDNLQDIEVLRERLLNDLRYLRKKSIFSMLSLDLDGWKETPLKPSKALQKYITAFSRQDKETYKLIQSCSYIKSFYEFLAQHRIVNQQITFHAIGNSDRLINAVTLTPQQLAFLDACVDIYKNKKNAPQNIRDAREQIVKTIINTAPGSFTDGSLGTAETFIECLFDLGQQEDGQTWIAHEEVLTIPSPLLNAIDSQQLNPLAQTILQTALPTLKNNRDAHAALIDLSLQDPSLDYLFLLASPGTGKTTAIVNYIKRRFREHQEGTLLLYISPRKHVNGDIIEKFFKYTGEDACSETFAITTNAVVTQASNMRKVHYTSGKRSDSFTKLGIRFISEKSDEAKVEKRELARIEALEEAFLYEKKQNTPGVLDTLCSGLNVCLKAELSQIVVGTVAVQSLKQLPDKSTTLKYLKNILPGDLEAFRKKFKNIFIMIDEITGDQAGPEFLHGIHKFLANSNLLQSSLDFNTKVIVADASLVGDELVEEHLGNTGFEANKIVCRSVRELPFAISATDTDYRHRKARIINANTYPADELRLVYHIGIDTLHYKPETYQERSNAIIDDVQNKITFTILDHLARKDGKQLLIYIQDKGRLEEIIQKVFYSKQQNFHLYEHYLEVHANISDSQKQKILEHLDIVPIVFMTASASRGLSFKKARHIIVEVPHFEVEQNLMEILQVIYRGRGADEEDCGQKTVSFYLTERIAYELKEQRSIAIREHLLHVVNVLLLLKGALDTRIKGYGNLGRKRYAFIPIGGKSIGGAGETFSTQMGNLIYMLKSLERHHRKDQRLPQVRRALEGILSRASIDLVRRNDQITADQANQVHFLPAIPNFHKEFIDLARQGFAQLLSWKYWEKAYIVGNILIAPIIGRDLQEVFRLQMERSFQTEEGQEIINTMQALARDNNYPDTLHILIQRATDLLKAAKKHQSHQTTKFGEKSSFIDQYCAFPLHAFLAHEEFAAFFDKRDDGQQLALSFRSIMEATLRKHFSISNILPLDAKYEHFPFLLFRSLSISEARQNLFKRSYMLTSHEMSLLNLMLTTQSEQDTP